MAMLMNINFCNALEWFTALSAIAAAGSALMAWRSLTHQRRDRILSDSRRESERLLQHAILTLERAYMGLMKNDASQNTPPRDRLAWLSASRLLEEYKETKSAVLDPLLKRELESHEEHWRRQFYLKLEPLMQADSAFFKPSDPNEANAIHLLSAVIIHAFADWPDDKEDPIEALGSAHEAKQSLRLSKKWITLHTVINNSSRS